MTTSARRLAVRIFAPSLLLAALLAAPGVVNASGAAKPDGWIQVSGDQPGPWKGKNIYNTTGLNQAATDLFYGDELGWGDQRIFAVNIQNDGSKSDRFKVKAPSSGWKIKYFHGSTNITSAVVAGTYQTSSLAPGASAAITVKVDVDTISLDGTGTRLITITSSSDSTKNDAVKLKMKIGSCGC